MARWSCISAAARSPSPASTAARILWWCSWIERWNRAPSAERARCVCRTEKIGWAEPTSSVLRLASSRRGGTGVGVTPPRREAGGVAGHGPAQTVEISASRRAAASRTAGTSTSSRASSSSWSVTLRVSASRPRSRARARRSSPQSAASRSCRPSLPSPCGRGSGGEQPERLRTVARLTPKSRASADSTGSRSPGCSSPRTISSRSWSASSCAGLADAPGRASRRGSPTARPELGRPPTDIRPCRTARCPPATRAQRCGKSHARRVLGRACSRGRSRSSSRRLAVASSSISSVRSSTNTTP